MYTPKYLIFTSTVLLIMKMKTSCGESMISWVQPWSVMTLGEFRHTNTFTRQRSKMSTISNLDVAVSSFWQLARHWNQGDKAKLELSCENGSLHMQRSAVLGQPASRPSSSSSFFSSPSSSFFSSCAQEEVSLPAAPSGAAPKWGFYQISKSCLQGISLQQPWRWHG